MSRFRGIISILYCSKQRKMQIIPLNLDCVLLLLHNSKLAYLIITFRHSIENRSMNTSFSSKSNRPRETNAGQKLARANTVMGKMSSQGSHHLKKMLQCRKLKYIAYFRNLPLTRKLMKELHREFIIIISCAFPLQIET